MQVVCRVDEEHWGKVEQSDSQSGCSCSHHLVFLLSAETVTCHVCFLSHILTSQHFKFRAKNLVVGEENLQVWCVLCWSSHCTPHKVRTKTVKSVSIYHCVVSHVISCQVLSFFFYHPSVPLSFLFTAVHNYTTIMEVYVMPSQVEIAEYHVSHDKFIVTLLHIEWFGFFTCTMHFEGPILHPFSDPDFFLWTPVEQLCTTNDPKTLLISRKHT